MFRWTYNRKYKGWRFYEPNGEFVKGWKHFTMADGEKNVHWSYFDLETGIMATGWKYFKKGYGNHIFFNHWCYFGHNGYMRQGWYYMTEEDGVSPPEWHYFNNKGHAIFGFYDDGQLHYLDNTGAMQTGWQKINDHWYFFNERGWANRNGFFKIKGKLRYFNRNARLVSKLQVHYKGKVYAHNDDLEGELNNGIFKRSRRSELSAGH